MSQDNNEAASAPVPRVGGPDEAKPESSDLAHVARQRQECPLGCTGPEQGGSGCAAVTGDCAMDTSSAAVAEGVDTAEFPKVAARFYMTEATKENPWRKESFSIEEEHRQKVEGVRGFHTPALEFITVEQGLTYGAQQREAGRRERAELDVRSLKEQSQAWFAVCGALSELRPNWKFEQPDSARNCKEAAVATIRALARQPVSDGTGLMKCGVCGDGQLYCNSCGTGQAILSAVPPAKAVSEGLRALPQYARVREEFEVATRIGARFDPDSAMLLVDALIAAVPPAKATQQPELTVWEGAMPESNGKSNFTAVLMRKDQMWDGPHVTIERSEYPDRIRYEADRVRFLIGELADEPDILAYDANKHSGYVPPAKAEGVSDCGCGCNDPVATEPIEMLEFLARRFEHAGVSSAVAPKYARDIRAILAQQAKKGEKQQ